jgi:hypothetical protein
MNLRNVAFAIFLCATTALPALGQDFSMMSNWAQGQMNQDNLRRNLANSGNAAPRSNQPVPYAVGPGIRTPQGVTGRPIPVGPGAAPSGAASTGAAAQSYVVHGAATTVYRSSPQVEAVVKQQFLTTVRKTGGEKVASFLTADMQQKNYLQLWAQHNVPDGLRLGDVADIFTSYWVENWQMANKVNYVPAQQVQAVRRQVNAVMLANPGFAQMTDAQKQAMGEIFIYSQVVEDAAYVDAMKKGDTAAVQRLADAAVARFESEMRVNLRTLKITNNGFTAM